MDRIVNLTVAIIVTFLICMGLDYFEFFEKDYALRSSFVILMLKTIFNECRLDDLEKGI